MPANEREKERKTRKREREKSEPSFRLFLFAFLSFEFAFSLLASFAFTLLFPTNLCSDCVCAREKDGDSFIEQAHKQSTIRTKNRTEPKASMQARSQSKIQEKRPCVVSYCVSSSAGCTVFAFRSNCVFWPSEQCRDRHFWHQLHNPKMKWVLMN